MLNRRRLSLAAVTVASLLAASGASADPINRFAGAAAPSHVPPSTTRSYTVSLTSNPASPDRAQRATIGIPSGFDVHAGVQATTTAVDGSCVASTWVPDGVLIADQRINLQRPGDDTTALCPGATLTVAFDADSAATDGTYTWTSQLLNDTSGAFTPSGSQPSVVVDGTAPTVTITGKPSDPSNDGDPPFVFSAGEPSMFECKLDGAAFAPCSSPQTYPDLADGTHTFAVRATDAAGNTSEEATFTWRIDTVAPTTTIGSKPINPSPSRSPSFGFTASEGGSSFSCRLDGADFDPCPSPKSYTGLGDGSHTFEVRATDQAGNTGAVDAYAWTIDTIAPTTEITGHPANPSRESAPSFSFSASESGSNFSCSLDGAAFTSCVSVKSYATLADGPHTFAVRAEDAAGNTGSAANYAWTIDTVAPTLSITDQPNDPSNVTTPSFGFTASESGSSFSCRLDDAAFAPCGSPRSFTGLADGLHTFVVKPIDQAGNPGTETKYSWTIDTVAPTATITGPPSDPSNDTSPSFSFIASDSGSEFACKLDGGGFENCASPKNYPALAEGSHTFAVRATDPAGNIGPSDDYTWTIDTAAPTATITDTPSDPSNVTSPTFSFSATESGSTFSCSIDGGAFEPCGSPKSYTSLANGSHSFVVKATDSAGNLSAGASFSWTIDTVAPTATITSKPNDPSNVTAPSFAFTATESGSTFVCRLGTVAFSACDSPEEYAGLSQGLHSFSVKAIDAAGNTSEEATFTWRIDTVAPTTTIGSKPINPSPSRSPSFGFTASEGGSSFSCRLDGADFDPCPSPKSYTGLGDGSHTFEVRATDQAGNTGPAEPYTWTIDTTPPTIAITDGPTDPTNDSSASFSFTTNEPGSSFTCRRDGLAFSSCTSPKNYGGLADGLHTFEVRATDSLGNIGPVTTYSWTIDTVAPTATIIEKPEHPTNDSTPRFTFSSSETGSTFACRLEQGGFAPCSSPKTYGALLEGQHAFAVRATDLAGNTGAAAAYTWTIDSTAPAASITSRPSNPSNSLSASFSFTASEDGSTFACRIDTAAFEPCTSPAGYSGLGNGLHTFRVRATDSAGNSGTETTYAWTIDTVAPTATILEKPEDPTNESTPSFTFTPSEPGSTFTCSLDDGAFVSCSSPKSYPHLVDGTHTFAVKATDAAGNTGPAAGYTWRIDTGAPTIELTATPPDPSNVKSASFVFSADDTNATFACKLDNASFGPCSSPQGYLNLADGRHTFSVRATNAAGNTGERTYTWTIDTVAPAAAITAKPSSPTNSRSPSFAFTAGESVAFYCKLDLGGFAPCGSPHSYSDLLDGTHTFAVFAADAAGNVGPQAAYDWLIKTQASGAVLTSAPAGLSNSSAASFVFSAAELSSFECNLDDHGFAPCGSPATYHGLGDGPHGFSVRAQDGLGNLSAPVSHSWTVDTTAPETRVTSAPASGRSTSATFWFTTSEAGTFECRLDGAPFALCGSPKSYGGLRLGQHQFEVRAIDAAGNADTTPALHGWRVDAPAAKKVASALLSPKAGARTMRPPLLVWRRVKKARYYNVQVFRGSRKVLSGWPTRTRLQLRAQWKYLGRKQRLVPGRYRWYVWPGYGAPSGQRYGPLLGQSTFVVARSVRR
jgi:large repetitive protein